MAKILRIEGTTLTGITGTTKVLIVPNNVNTIARHTFRNYQGETIVLPKDLKVIGPNTFKNCTSTVYIEKKELPGIHTDAFSGFLGELKPRGEYTSSKEPWYKRLFK